MGKYIISEVISSGAKFCCKVSFNDGTPEYCEVEIPNDSGEEEIIDENGNKILVKRQSPEMSAKYVSETLQKIADDHEAFKNSITEKESYIAEVITVVDGKIVIE